MRRSKKLTLLASATALFLGVGLGCNRSGGGSGGPLASTAPTSTPAPTTSGSTAAGATTAAVPVTSSTVPASAPLLAGAAKVDVTPPRGVPLSGYGGGDRRNKFPNLNPFAYDHFLAPSTGTRDPINARALYVSDGKERVVILALDAIASSNEAIVAAWQKARTLGSSVPLENLMVCSSHTHSGPGCLTTLWFWQLTAADLYQPTVFDGFTDGLARAIVEAERAAVPARLGVASRPIPNVTHNRRRGVSGVFTGSSIDPEALVLRVDRASGGTPIATLWNFAIHGISLGEDSHVYSADIMGGANDEIESHGGGVSLFINSAEGDITPRFHDDAGIRQGGKIIADEVFVARANASTIASAEVKCVSEMVDFGQATLDVTQGRLGPQGAAMLASQGWLTALQRLGLGPALGLSLHLPSGWIETQFRYQGIRIGKWGFTAMPGEAIHTIGLDLKKRGKALGFDHTFTCGLANGHMAYITTEQEYWFGGYEALATFWGPKTGEKLVNSCERQLAKVKP